MVDLILRKGAEEARNQLSGSSRCGREGPFDDHYQARPSSCSVGADRGVWRRHSPAAADARHRIGRGLWGKKSTRTLRKLRDEWNR